MDNTNYTAEFLFEKSPAEIYTAINNVSGWWTGKTEGSAMETGNEFKVAFGETWKIFRVTELVAGKKVAWLVVDSQMPWNPTPAEWNGTTVRFDIAEQDGRTHLLFTHDGLTPALACFDACNSGWNYYLKESLQKLIETGSGKPYAS